MANDSAVDDAVLAKLSGDATLSALMPDGVFLDVARRGTTRFVIVSQVIEEDEPQFDGAGGAIGIQRFLYLVKAVELNTIATNTNSAAAQIQTLLQGVALSISGFAHSLTRRVERVAYTEVDVVDNDIRWQHRGGRYELFVSPL